MSVNAGDRSQSKLEVLYQAIKLNDALTNLCLRSFGIYSKNSPFRKKYIIVTKYDPDKTDLIDRMIEDEIHIVCNLSSKVVELVNAANAIYPRSSEEFELRISYQNESLATCEMIEQELNSMARVFDADINYFKEAIEVLCLERHLIVEWRKSDKFRFKRYSL